MARKRNALLHLGPLERPAPTEKQRQEWIREAAYYKAINRHFAPDHELMDWLAAEQEVEDLCRHEQAVHS